ncbi:uncharacterized protein MONOS_8749 [Monocercomonoides exilis]|uniref:uncharacterized protein n=1 Tax=Monocercomonoides exilis TaxID=2049356 RepID=UPI00355A2369|nr:hypothetical protein MONOS_8749 [Monocercomonoides exilis]|eukprot:MONOS_8749.1-p1 / transcript=MONOS_8749.1 / gene=MONOS_8749 / organism=Monocercomonoides_exilis_PA203 / gene_product=unspecified product / transcript_product=unspecified product / location=Mono_scaffold00338:48034-48836(-) / protein_length=215 / sequence_SO=supercontig / SO=protein_coding / is_pseudo=false
MHIAFICSLYDTAKKRRERSSSSNGRSKEDGFQKQVKRGDEERKTAGRAKGEDEDEGERRLHTQNTTASSTIAFPPFSPLLHAQLSATSLLVGTPLPPATDTSSLTQKSFYTTGPSSSSLSPSSFSSSFSHSHYLLLIILLQIHFFLPLLPPPPLLFLPSATSSITQNRLIFSSRKEFACGSLLISACQVDAARGTAELVEVVEKEGVHERSEV